MDHFFHWIITVHVNAAEVGSGLGTRGRSVLRLYATELIHGGATRGNRSLANSRPMGPIRFGNAFRALCDSADSCFG